MEKILKLKTSNIVALLGVGDSNLELIEKAYLVKLVVRGNIIKINGDVTTMIPITSTSNRFQKGRVSCHSL